MAKRFLHQITPFASALAGSTNEHFAGTSTASLNSDSSSGMTARTEGATAFGHPAGSASVMDYRSPPYSNVRASLSPSRKKWRITGGIGCLSANRFLQSSPIWKSMIPATHSSTTHEKRYEGS